MIKKAVIPAAGLGTRFKPFTKTLPKEMLPIVDSPAIEYVVQEAFDAGIDDVIIVIGNNKDSIVNYFDNVNFVKQPEPKGLGHAIYCARKHIGDEPFAVLLGDDIIRNNGGNSAIKQMIDVYKNYFGGTIIGVEEILLEDSSKYGIVRPSELIKYEKHHNRIYIDDIIEKPKPSETPSNLAAAGRYILKPKIFDILREQKAGLNGEIQLTDALKKYAEDNKIMAYKFEGKRYDVGNKVGYLKASIEFALERKDIGKEIKEYLSNLNL